MLQALCVSNSPLSLSPQTKIMGKGMVLRGKDGDFLHFFFTSSQGAKAPWDCSIQLQTPTMIRLLK